MIDREQETHHEALTDSGHDTGPRPDDGHAARRTGRRHKLHRRTAYAQLEQLY